MGNKERFQEIQQAYTSVLKRRRDSGDGAGAGSKESSGAAGPRPGSGDDVVGHHAKEATDAAEVAKEDAESVTSAAHRSFLLRAQGSEARGMNKKAALYELKNLARQGSLLLRVSADHLRNIRSSVSDVARNATGALEEYGDWASTAMAGAGLRERTEIVESSGESCQATAEHLEKMADSDETMLQKMEKASNESDLSSDVLALHGVRLLSESLMRTVTVARCAADEAIGAAMAALELSCSLVALDSERKEERAAQAAERRQAADSEAPVVVHCGDDSDSGMGADGTGTVSKGYPGAMDSPDGESTCEKNAGSDGKDGKSLQVLGDEQEVRPSSRPEDVKSRQVVLRVRNLRCLNSLNDEVLSLQGRLKGLLKRGEGTLMPTVAPSQKGGVFDLVAQLLQNALTEAARLVVDAAVPARQVLERAFPFALALENAQEVALPTEVKTQALKLAALLDVDLLCQIIDGPFKRRLLSLGMRRPGAPAARGGSVGIAAMRATTGAGGARFPRPGGGSGLSEAWNEAVQAFCLRLVRGLRDPLQPEKRGDGPGAGWPGAGANFYATR